MKGLLYKDFCVMKKELLLCALTMAGFSLVRFIPWQYVMEANDTTTKLIDAESMTFAVAPMVVYLFLFITISVAQTGLFAHDERKAWSAYIGATPLGPKGQILSKYYMTLLLSFSVVVWGFVCDSICTLISGINGSSAGLCIAMFFIQLLLRAIEMPFVICFGEKHGKTCKVLLLGVVTFVGIVYLLFGKLPENMSMDRIFDFLTDFTQNESIFSTTMLAVAAIFPYTVMLLYYTSYKISCKLYQRGVNTYEN